MSFQPAAPAQSPAPPAPAPSAPSLPAAQAPVATTGSDLPINRSISSADLAALRSRRSALSSQLGSASERRRDVLEELKNTPAGPGRTGLEERLKVLDERIIQLERDIAQNSQLIASAPVAGTSVEPGSIRIGGTPVDMTAISIVFTLFVLFPVALSVARGIWRRGSLPPAAKADPELVQRLARLETAVDTIAVEIERISEGQRFVSKVLAERPALGAGPMEPVKVAAPAERVEQRRD